MSEFYTKKGSFRGTLIERNFYDSFDAAPRMRKFFSLFILKIYVVESSTRSLTTAFSISTMLL